MLHKRQNEVLMTKVYATYDLTTMHLFILAEASKWGYIPRKKNRNKEKQPKKKIVIQIIWFAKLNWTGEKTHKSVHKTTNIDIYIYI